MMEVMCCVVCDTRVLQYDIITQGRDYTHRLKRVLTSEVMCTYDVIDCYLCDICVERLEKIEELLQIQTTFIQEFIATGERRKIKVMLMQSS